MQEATTESKAKAVLYDVEWQALRVSLLSANNHYGGFGTEEGVKKNLHILYDYYEAVEEGQEQFYRGWRILNLLNATLLGYGERMAGTQQELDIKESRDVFSTIHREDLDYGFEFGDWDWNKVKADLLKLQRDDVRTFILVWRNLDSRVQSAYRKQRAGTGGMAHRGELQKFMGILEACLAGVE